MKHSFDDEIVKICNDLANQGIRVIVAGLDMDFKGNLFGPMPQWQPEYELVHAVCTRTGNLAIIVFKPIMTSLYAWRNRRIRAIKSPHIIMRCGRMQRKNKSSPNQFEGEGAGAELNTVRIKQYKPFQIS
jgi:thymidine kinase